jgi:hypothetical protein
MFNSVVRRLALAELPTKQMQVVGRFPRSTFLVSRSSVDILEVDVDSPVVVADALVSGQLSPPTVDLWSSVSTFQYFRRSFFVSNQFY